MLSWLLLRLGISAALISTVDPNCADNALSFKVKETHLIFDIENARQFLSCLCITSYGCEFTVNNTLNKIDIILAKTFNATGASLSQVFSCSYSVDTIRCELLVVIPEGQCVTSFNETGCYHILSTVNCSADSISLTWNHLYTVTCHTFYDNSMCINDKNINYTIKDCENGASHLSTFSSLDTVTSSANTRETFITTANVSGVYPIKDITENNWNTIVAVTVSVGGLLFIIFLILAVIMYRRRRQNAKSTKTVLDAVKENGKTKTDGNVDANFINNYTQAKTTLIAEPYNVMQRNEISKDVDPTIARTFTLQKTGHESTNYATVAKSDDKSVSASTLIVHSELKKSNENLPMEKSGEESASVYSKLGEKNKVVENIYGVLKIQNDAKVSDRISPAADDQIIKPCSHEHIYFELERENRNSDLSICSDQNVK
ncbi:unnamed protein product [Lymnaea stagnalis]|uniref:Uncharacterized protein n=1 Tax=Lymnaea stagnalis TaxID=6523 RepID=A0AAV2HNK1_LYMST